jgi:hypothetical protein
LMKDDGVTQGGSGLPWYVNVRDYMSGIESSSVYEVVGDYVKEAERHIRGWGLWVYGPGRQDGGCRELTNVLAVARRAVDVHGCNLVVLDNYQQVDIDTLRGGDNPDYIVMKTVVGKVSNLVSSRKVAHIGVSQVGRSGKYLGGVASQYEANVALLVERKGKDGNDLAYDEFDVQSLKSREGPRFRVRFRWEPVTGLILDGWEP